MDRLQQQHKEALVFQRTTMEAALKIQKDAADARVKQAQESATQLNACHLRYLEQVHVLYVEHNVD